MYLRQSRVSLNNITFINNYAKSAGTIVIEGDTEFNATNCVFKDNKARDSSAIFA